MRFQEETLEEDPEGAGRTTAMEWSSHYQQLLAFVQSPTEDEEGMVHLLSCDCRNYNILSIIMSM